MLGENRYLIVGIDEYPKGLYQKLYNSKIDGVRFAKVLEDRYGFIPACDPIYDDEATHNNIMDALHDLVEASYKDDSLIIYFAGHGLQHPHTKRGFWIPYDGENDRKKHINNSYILESIEEIQAKHILLISDSCYSGTFITRTRSGGKILTSDELESLPSRWVFVSGGEESVKDGIPGEGSPFSIALCNFLEHNVSPTLTALEIFNEVVRVIENRGGQQPAASDIKSDAHCGGQMVFRLRHAIKGGDDLPPVLLLKFELPKAKIQFYIPRLLRHYDYQEHKQVRFYQPEVGIIYLNSLIRTQKRVVLLGAAGSGKSVELLSLAQQLQAKNDPITPIFKRFNTYTEENIGDYLPKKWQDADPNNLVLFLDGLDEVQPKHFQTAIRKITAFVQQNPLIRMVISCRNNFYELPSDNFSGTLDTFSVYTLNDVSIPEIIRYAREKFELDGEDFIAKVQKASFLDLVQKPFFLNILILYYKGQNNFDNGRAGIMDEALLEYYDNDKQHFNSTVPTLSKSMIFGILEKVAFVMELIGRNFITDDDLLKIFPLTDELDRCKYLPAFNRDSATGRWMFEHNNLQEYISSRVLNSKTATEIIEIIAVNTTGKLRVKPSWVNTLSFFVSIGKEETVKDLFKWIIEHDREVIVKFEPERLSINQRVQLFKDIFTFYSAHGIWIRSNKFSDVDLARFGESSEILAFLLEIIRSGMSNRVARLNAVHILSHYNIARFSNEHKKIQASLLGLLEAPDILANDTYTIIGALSYLRIASEEVIHEIVDRYRERRNQYIRAALYKLIISAKKVDQYIHIFIDGIDLAELKSPVNDREDVNLFDESFLLKTGLQNIKTAGGLFILLKRLAESKNKRELLTSDYREILTSIINVGVLLFPEHPELLEAVLDLFIADGKSYTTSWGPEFLVFFEKTGTRWQAFKKTWERKDLEEYIKAIIINVLLNAAVIHEIVNYLRGFTTWKIQLNEFYEFIFWNKRFSLDGIELIEQFETAALAVFGVKLERPVLKDLQQIQRLREQKSFDLWFDDEAILTEINRVFEETKLTEIDRDQLFQYNYQGGIDVEEKMLSSVYLIFNHLTQRRRVINKIQITNFIAVSDEYQNLRIGHIHSDLLNRKSMEVNDKQIAFIDKWAQGWGNNRRILWDFMMRFNLKIPEPKVLDLTNYNHLNYDVKLSEPGTIEELEKFVAVAKIKVKVIENIQTQTDLISWVNNVGYALRKSFVETFGNIVDRIQAASDFEYRFSELLIIWFTKTRDIERLKTLILNIKDNHLRWDAIKIVMDNNLEPEFLNAFFQRLIISETETLDEKIQAANHLMRQDDLTGFDFMADLIIGDPNPKFDYRLNLRSISLLKNVRAIPKLMILLKIGKQPDYKRDNFNDLEDKVVSTLRNIGIQSTDNYFEVKSAVEDFIKENAGIIPNVSFLHFVSIHMEDQIKIQQTESLTVEEGIHEYNRLFKIND